MNDIQLKIVKEAVMITISRDHRLLIDAAVLLHPKPPWPILFIYIFLFVCFLYI